MTSQRPASRAPGTKGAVAPLLALVLSSAVAAQPIAVPSTFVAPGSWSALVDAVEPAVVSIHAASIEAASADGADGGAGDPFEFFFGDRQRPEGASPDGDEPPAGDGAPGRGEDGAPFRTDAGGSGFLVSKDGLVVTNHHVVEGARSVRVTVGGHEYPAEVRGVDAATDLALLAIVAGRDLPYLELGDSDSVAVGDPLLVIGNPLDLDHTVTTGVLSAKHRSIGINDVSFEDFLQTDAAINFGNSGGPIVDVHGRVVGIATAINYGAENVGFAVPANTLRDVLPQLRDHGRVVRGSLGAAVVNLDDDLAAAFALPATDGALVGTVVPGSAAERAGVVHGDVVVAVDGRRVARTRDLITYVASRAPGTEVTLDVVRAGQPLQLRATLGERPPLAAGPAVPEPVAPAADAGDWLGIDTAALEPAARKRWQVPADVDGVLVTAVDPWSALYERGLRPGCVLSELDGRPLAKAAEVAAARAAAKPGSWLRFYATCPGRGGFFAVAKAP